MDRRVVVTGLGAVTSIGNTAIDFWYSIKNGVSGGNTITHFDSSKHKTKIACEVKNFIPSERMDRRMVYRLDSFSHFIVAAAKEAMDDAGLSESSQYDPDRAGTIMGVGIGGFHTYEEAVASIFMNGPTISPFTIPKMISNIAPGQLAINYNLRGPVCAVTTACASGTDAITFAYRSIAFNETDVIITGGGESSITATSISGFNALKALSRRNDAPQHASRPFDKDRDGFVMGEGAGILILEELEHAKKRGAKIYAEVIGSAMTCDAYHLTAPHTTGRGATAAMRKAIEHARLNPEDIDYINAHGTSTKINDAIETMAIKDMFHDHAHKVNISSTKSMHGHMLGAAGGVEAIVSILAIRDQFVPPTINLETPDTEYCDLDYTANVGREAKINISMSNSFGFGGHNGVVIFRSV